MDGFFMGKMIKRIMLCFLICVTVWGFSLLRDRTVLNDQLIRLHVVANSDSDRDQNVKLQVRDAILASLQEDLNRMGDVEAARVYIKENLPKLQEIANNVIHSAGMEQQAAVRLCREVFPVRYYETFRLPSGIYETLKITIGEGAGHNWWCVTFPGLCLPSTSEGFADAAVGAGFSEALTGTLSYEADTQLRFFILDWMGQVEAALFLDS